MKSVSGASEEAQSVALMGPQISIDEVSVGVVNTSMSSRSSIAE
jgi:hypothetical protein